MAKKPTKNTPSLDTDEINQVLGKIAEFKPPYSASLIEGLTIMHKLKISEPKSGFVADMLKIKTKPAKSPGEAVALWANKARRALLQA
ncbi:MAG: hypothetical protein AAF582_00110 [Pseudomonadota bacterium]